MRTRRPTRSEKGDAGDETEEAEPCEDPDGATRVILLPPEESLAPGSKGRMKKVKL